MQLFKALKKTLNVDVCMLLPADFGDAGLTMKPGMQMQELMPWERVFLESKFHADKTQTDAAKFGAPGILVRHGALVTKERREHHGQEFISIWVKPYGKTGSEKIHDMPSFDLFYTLKMAEERDKNGDPNPYQDEASYALWVFDALILAHSYIFEPQSERGVSNIAKARASAKGKMKTEPLEAYERRGETLIYKRIDRQRLAQKGAQHVEAVEEQGEEADRTLAYHPRREHDVRGHWRTYKSGKRVWINAHRRGHAELGNVSHIYDIR